MDGYILILGQTPNTYTGFRAATADMEVNQGEWFVESLEGWTVESITVPKRPMMKRDEIAEAFKALSIETRAVFSDVAGRVYTALGTGDVELATYWIKVASQHPQADPDFIAQLLVILEVEVGDAS